MSGFMTLIVWEVSTLCRSILLELWRFLGSLRWKSSSQPYGIPIWTGLQSTWTHLGVLVGVLDVSLEASSGVLEPSWGVLEALWAVCESFGSCLGVSSWFFKPFGIPLGASWRPLGAFLDIFFGARKRLGNDFALAIQIARLRRVLEADLYWFW